MDHFNFNGKLFKQGTPVIGSSSRGFRYGDGLFETIKCIEGKLVLADEHFARLWKGMQVLQIKVPKHFTPEELQEEIIALAEKNSHAAKARVRLTVSRGEGGLYDDINHSPNYLIESWALPEDNGALNSNGLVLGIYPAIKKSYDILSSLKHNNYLPYVMAALFAKENKWNDAILLNTGGRLCDTSIANIFLVKNEVVYTPSLPEACVAGIMRSHLVRELPAMGYNLIEKQLSIQELVGADEVFLTNAIYNIRWVQCMEDTTYSNIHTRKIYNSILPTIS
jgi:branched-chain amino acid aminotransferase